MGLLYKKMDLTPVWSEKPKLKRPEKKALTKFETYKARVFELTEETKHLIDGIENRGYRKFHIDHKISIKWGFDNKIPEKDIAHIDNLRMLWWKDNFIKNIICEVDHTNKWILGDLTPYKNRNDIYFKEDE